MKIKHVCPEAQKPVSSKFIGQGIITKEDFVDTGNGLHAPTKSQWMSVKVKCSYCGKIHEYALRMDLK